MKQSEAKITGSKTSVAHRLDGARVSLIGLGGTSINQQKTRAPLAKESSDWLGGSKMIMKCPSRQLGGQIGGGEPCRRSEARLTSFGMRERVFEGACLVSCKVPRQI